MPSKNIVDFAYQVRDYMRSAEVVEGKNKLKDNGTIDGTNIWTKNANLTYTANGSAGTRETEVIFDISYLSGHYVFSGCPSGGSESTYDVFAWDYTTGTRIPDFDGNPSVSDYGTGGIEIDIPSGHNTALRLRIKANQTVSNLLFEPMICTLADWNKSHEYEPYYAPVKDRLVVEDITSQLQVNTSLTAYEVVSGYTHCTRYGNLITFMCQLKSLTENAAPAGRAFIKIFSNLPKPLYNILISTDSSRTGNNKCESYMLHDVVSNMNPKELCSRGGTIGQYYTIYMVYLTED